MLHLPNIAIRAPLADLRTRTSSRGLHTGSNGQKGPVGSELCPAVECAHVAYEGGVARLLVLLHGGLGDLLAPLLTEALVGLRGRRHGRKV